MNLEENNAQAELLNNTGAVPPPPPRSPTRRGPDVRQFAASSLPLRPAPGYNLSTIWAADRAVTKPLIDLEDYFKILERTVSHPRVTPRFTYQTYLANSRGFLATNLRPYNTLYSAAALRAAPRPRMILDYDIAGSAAAKITKALEDEDENVTHITKDCFLYTSTQGCRGILLYLQEIVSKLNVCIGRGKRVKNSQTHHAHEFGLGQLGGFCKELYNLTNDVQQGTRIFAITATIGFAAVQSLLNDRAACESLQHTPFKLNYCPSEDALAQARIKIQAAYDSVLESYQRIGRPGFRGNWTDVRRCDDRVIRADEIESLLAVFMDAFAQISAVTADLVEVFRTFVYSDNVQKTYLLLHLETFPLNDVNKIVDNIALLRERIAHVHQVLAEIMTIAGQGMNLFCPPPLDGPPIPPWVQKVETPPAASDAPSMDALFYRRIPTSMESVSIQITIPGVVNSVDNLPVPRQDRIVLPLDRLFNGRTGPVAFSFQRRDDGAGNESG